MKIDFKDNKFFINLLYSGIYQGVNLILLIVLVPFYIQTYGIEHFGIINLGQAFGLYILALCDFNFLVKGVREVNANISNPKDLGSFYIESVISKLLLFIFGYLFGLIIILFIPNFNHIFADLSIGMLYGLSLSIVPLWLLQGLQFTKPLALIHSPIRLLGIVFIFLFLTDKTDYFWVNPVLIVSNFIATIVILISLYKNKKIILSTQISTYRIFDNLRLGKRVCFANISVNTYMNLNTVVLGIFASPEIVGLYSLAEKAIIGFRQILSVIASVLYPMVCEKVLNFKNEVNRFVFISGTSLVFMYIIFTGFLIIFREPIITFLSNSHNSVSTTNIMFILSLTLPIVALNVPFWLTLNANGLEKQVSNIAILTAMISLIVNAVLSKMFFALGTAFSVLFTETFFTIGVILLSIQHKIFKHNEQNS